LTSIYIYFSFLNYIYQSVTISNITPAQYGKRANSESQGNNNSTDESPVLGKGDNGRFEGQNNHSSFGRQHSSPSQQEPSQSDTVDTKDSVANPPSSPGPYTKEFQRLLEELISDAVKFQDDVGQDENENENENANEKEKEKDS